LQDNMPKRRFTEEREEKYLDTYGGDPRPTISPHRTPIGSASSASLISCHRVTRSSVKNLAPSMVSTKE
jgi:hypothetical protein